MRTRGPVLLRQAGAMAALCCALSAQPSLNAIINAASPEGAVAQDSLASAYGVGFSKAAFSAGSLPFPVQLGDTSLVWCDPLKDPRLTACQAFGLVYVSPTQINFLVPSTIPTDRRIIVRVQQAGPPSTSSDFMFQFSPLGPAIFWMGYDCLTDTRFQDANRFCGLSYQNRAPINQADRGAITDQFGHLLTSSNRAKLGQAYTIWLTGLGHFTGVNPPAPVQMLITNVPVYGYPGDTYIIQDLLFVGPSPQFPGLYQINFILPAEIAAGHPSGYPPPWPCGDYNWEVSLDLHEGSGYATVSANLVQIPIHVARGDVACQN